MNSFFDIWNNIYQLVMLLRNGKYTGKNYIVVAHGGQDHFISMDTSDNYLHMFNEDLINIMLNEFEANFAGGITYQDIVHMRTLGNYDNVINNLPKNLKSLYIMSTTIHSIDLSNCISTLESLVIDTSNINMLPDISRCCRLHTFKIMRSGIYSFPLNYQLPYSLNELNLESNHISNVEQPFNYYALIYLASHSSKTIQLSGNCLSYTRFPEQLLSKCNLIRQKYNDYTAQCVHFAEHEQRQVYFDTQHQRQEVQPKTIAQLNAQRAVATVVNDPSKLTKSIIENKQNVHMSSVNLSVQRSVKIMEQFVENNEITVLPLTIPPFSIFKWLQYILRAPSYPTSCCPIALFHSCCHHYMITPISYLQHQWNKTDVYSLTTKTYKQTFELIWAIICFKHKQGHVKLADSSERLMTECTDGHGYCFVGQYNRLVNSMVGIVEGVQVGFSENEQLQLNFAQIIAKYNKKTITFPQLVEEAHKILQPIEDVDVKDAWLSPIMDMKPDDDTHI